MALSDHEQQLLDQLEQQLRSEDPRFASSISEVPQAGGGSLSASRLVVGVLGVVVGIAVALGGIWAGWWPLGIIGFAVMVAGGFWALKTNGGGSEGSGPSSGTGSRPAGPSSKGGAPAGGGFMNRMEDRWDRRRRGE